MAIAKQGNSYAINSGNLPFSAPKKTNSKALDTFNKKKEKEPKEPLVETAKVIEDPAKEAPIQEAAPAVPVMLAQEPTIDEATKKEESKQAPPSPKPVIEKNFKNSSQKLADYTGARKNTTFAFCDSNDISYIKIKANRLGMTYQDFLAEILLENIQVINDDAFDYTEETYQNTKRGLKNPVNDRFALKEDFLVDLKQAAANVGMKRSAFVAMCVHKARIADPNPAWDL